MTVSKADSHVSSKQDCAAACACPSAGVTMLLLTSSQTWELSYLGRPVRGRGVAPYVLLLLGHLHRRVVHLGAACSAAKVCACTSTRAADKLFKSQAKDTQDAKVLQSPHLRLSGSVTQQKTNQQQQPCTDAATPAFLPAEGELKQVLQGTWSADCSPASTQCPVTVRSTFSAFRSLQGGGGSSKRKHAINARSAPVACLQATFGREPGNPGPFGTGVVCSLVVPQTTVTNNTDKA